jgi:hypothetical protein
MANLRVDNVPVEVLWEIRLAAAADRLTMRDWMLNLISRGLDQEPEDRRKVGALGDVRPSPIRQRRVSGQSGAKLASQSKPLAQVETSAARRKAIEPCSHGLLFHPGCNT